MNQPKFVTTAPERRQIAQVLVFPAATAQYIDWSRVAAKASALSADFETRWDAGDSNTGACTVTLFWRDVVDEATEQPAS